MSKQTRIIDAITAGVAVVMVVYHMVNCYYSFFGNIEHRILHLIFALTIIFLGVARKGGKIRLAISMLLILSSIVLCAYLWIDMERLLQYIGFPLFRDSVVGFLIMGIVLTASYFAIGSILVIIVVAIMLYAFFGHYLGGPILSVNEIISTTVLNFGSYDMFGKILNVSASTIFLYIVYGGLLQGLRATDFIFELGKGLGRRTRSGPAMTAVVGSAMMGMTTGQTTPNIAVTGSFTIPLMKNAGYKPEVAGAIEAAASGGGQITPPIMSLGAFVMAEVLGVPFSDVIKMAAVPAALYYASIMGFVHLQALKSKIEPPVEQMFMRRVYATAPLFIFPLITILIILFSGYPTAIGAFWAIILLFFISFIRKETRPSISSMLEGTLMGVKTGAAIAAACASIGPAIALMTKTGLGLIIGYSVESWSGGNVFIGLIILMLATIVLGMELPTVAAYLIGAVIAVPPLVRMGLNIYGAHMFTFYFSGFSALTPPIGMAAVVASRLAGASYIKTALHAMAAAAAAYCLPYIFAYNEQLLLVNVEIFMFLKLLALTLLGLFSFQIGFVGYFMRSLTIVERLIAVLGGAGFFGYLISKSNIFMFVAVICLGIVILSQIMKYRDKKFKAS